MAASATPGPRQRPLVPAPFLPLLSICLSELRKDFRDLLQSNWAEVPRRRARELALTITEACEMQGLGQVARLARSMVALIELSGREAVPLARPLRKKLDELLRSAEGEVLELSRRASA